MIAPLTIHHLHSHALDPGTVRLLGALALWWAGVTIGRAILHRKAR